MMIDRSIFLVGFMGAGKTAAGRALASVMGRALVDTDDLVESRAGCSIERIFRESGEGRFRELEREALESLAGRKELVVATGGGLFLGVVQRRFLRAEGTTVWIDVPLEVARARLGVGGARPLWATGDQVALRAFYERRRVAYALADVRVPGAGATPEEVARRILERLRALPH